MPINVQNSIEIHRMSKNSISKLVLLQLENKDRAQERELNSRPPDKYSVALPLSYPGHRYLEILLAIIHKYLA